MTAAPQGLTSVDHGAALSHPRPEILALTGLRGLAAVAVVVHHIGVAKAAPETLHHLVEGGELGVPLFVLLSGFMLAYNYPTLNLWSGHRLLGRYAMARVARLVPLTMLAGLTAFLLGTAHGWAWTRAVFAEPAWFLGVVIVGYAVFPVLAPVVAAAAERSGRGGLVVVAATAFGAQLAVLALRLNTGSNAWLYHNPLSWIPDLALGMTLGFLIAGGWRIRSDRAHLIQVACLLYIVVVTMKGFGSAVWYGAVWTIPLGLLVLTIAGAPDSRTAGWLSSRFAVHLGVIGLALYLTHRPLVRGLGSLPDTDPVSALLLYCWIGLALLMAEGAHRYVGVPGRRWVMALARRWDRRG